jgi:hypothetical protein
MIQFEPVWAILNSSSHIYYLPSHFKWHAGCDDCNITEQILVPRIFLSPRIRVGFSLQELLGANTSTDEVCDRNEVAILFSVGFWLFSMIVGRCLWAEKSSDVWYAIIRYHLYSCSIFLPCVIAGKRTIKPL